jgi:catechol 2,3-dioxygenase
MSVTATHPSGSQALLSDATRLGAVELIVTDLDRSIPFYTEVIGLAVRERDAATAALGAGGEDLVVLHAQPGARPAGRHAGLYHYALLFPSREELARAGRRIAERRVPIDGASDHGTHEAIYLPDPDGIGIELAADRPRSQWPMRDGRVAFAGGPHPLDVPGLFATIEGEDYAPAAGAGLQMGHVHLHVGDLDRSTRFYRDGLGFEVMADMGSAVFVSAGRYHHHVGFNLWRGAGAAPAPEGVVGLRHWTLVTADAGERDAVVLRLEAIGAPAEERDGALLARDPSGIAVRVR